MSWKVRRFLRQVRDHKEEECKAKASIKKVTINETPLVEPTKAPPPPVIQPQTQTHNDSKTKPIRFSTPEHGEVFKELEVLTSSSHTQSTSSTDGRYINWTSQHTELVTQPWCCIGDLIAFCDKYEYKTLSLSDTRAHNVIIAEVKALLTIGQAPFDQRKRFPGNIHNPENLWICIGRCTGVEYHLQKILSVFRKPLKQLPVDKQRAARQNFHLAINELRLDISARISSVRLYDRNVFEREFGLQWQENIE